MNRHPLAWFSVLLAVLHDLVVLVRATLLLLMTATIVSLSLYGPDQDVPSLGTKHSLIQRKAATLLPITAI